MGLNIEIKARCLDHNSIEEIMNKMNFPFDGVEHQTDTFFNVPQGRLKLREYDNKPAVLIPYIRPDVKTPRISDYVLLKTDDPHQTLEILAHMFGVRMIVQKIRKIFFYDNVRIHLDEVEKLGTFIELEGVIKEPTEREETIKKVELLMNLFEIKDDDVIINAYIDLLEMQRIKN